MENKKKINILDVASHAGVSKTTVSRVMNNNGYVAQRTREKVNRAISELNYAPSAFAQNIRTGKSKTIAMMIPDTSNTFYMEIFKAVEDIALKNGYMVILCNTRRSFETEVKYADKLMKRNIDGLLYFTQQRTPKNEAFFRELSKKVPLVFMDYAFADVEDICCVAMECKSCSMDAVKLLYDKGKRNIAYINLPDANNVTLNRCEGYKQGLRNLGLSCRPGLVILPKESKTRTMVEIGYDAAKKLITENSDVDAVMTASDQLAIGVIKYLKAAKIRIPDDVSVLGFDDTVMCEIVNPPLTTIRQPIRKMGNEAAKLLIKMITEEQISQIKIIYNGSVIERQST